MASVFAQNHKSTTFNVAGLSRHDAYNKISTEILRLQDQIRSLYSLQNSLAPISCLPNELLSKVFMHCCDLNESGEYTNLRPEEGEEEDDDDKACLDTRLIVSWVSRQWRNVALGHKPLWNLVFSTMGTLPLDYARTCMERCQTLYIDARSPTPKLLQLYASHISQISHLKLGGPFELSDDFTWTQTAPLLQSLTLHIEAPAGILDSINPRMCPNLRSLDFQDYDFDWAFIARVASTLTSLTVKWPSSKITTTEFLHLLESLPLLNKCQISRCFEAVTDDTPSLPRRVCLPRLQSMAIYESVAAIIRLLRNISTPAASLQIISFRPQKNDAETEALLHTLRTTQGHIWESIRHLRDDRWLTVSSSSLSLKHIVSCRNSPNNLSLAFQYLNLDNLESLWTECESSEVMAKLSRLTQLRSIALNGSKPLRAFMTCMTSGSPGQDSMALFPALKELTLFGLDSGESLAELCDAQAVRKVWGVGLQRLEFVDCEGVRLWDIACLKKVVDEVEIGDRSRFEFLT
ncbi:hypothetical protein BDN72DRAFT_846694 [Pluteus cervinus]|uniref:Uncharacterized protein n=1 Tax=Pluteus cervinus TaxID=181527 RepID=A0ACD3AFM4_9AGAR|nr:hypothetical protein BDN72DRAFT_846694 [Pluteus cervinus]